VFNKERVAVYSKICTKHTTTLNGQNVNYVNVKPGSTYVYSRFYALKGEWARSSGAWLAWCGEIQLCRRCIAYP